MLIVKYQLASGASGEDVVVTGDKWVFGRPDGDESPHVSVDDRRVSRGALVIRDSGPGPVVFRGQRGEAARVGLVSTDGSTAWLTEGTAGHFTATARRVEMYLGDEHVVTIEVDFAERGSVVERQQQLDEVSASQAESQEA
ncbi:hypothetical protein [Aeromicrobium sp. Root495]|uniref:hypothetical protein n=1 Tax=Aeromicrobium sp. Root495 TaxID=1736550 RepID=UPI0010EDEFF7|nr:hypothetical protein [Aeromicrobium sp. Root495]RYJ06300.1 MAG: hypothetical protein EON52_07080 [Actinomycetales bacterium]